MKLINLSEKILKYMVESYAANGADFFSFDAIKKIFTGYSDDYLSKAIYILQDDGFVFVYDADNIAYSTQLLPNGIRQCQDNTILKKGYSLLKEIRSLLP